VSCSGAADCGVSAPVRRQQGWQGRSCFVGKQFRNAKIQKLHLPITSYHSTLEGLDIPMDDQVSVSLSYSAQHVKEKPDSRVHIKRVLVALCVDVLSLDVFKDEVGLATSHHTCIDQFSNVGTCESSKNFALSLEPLNSALRGQRKIQKLHGDSPLEPSVVALCEPHAAHSALADARRAACRLQRIDPLVLNDVGVATVVDRENVPALTRGVPEEISARDRLNLAFVPEKPPTKPPVPPQAGRARGPSED
jgi:hypothetical protein